MNSAFADAQRRRTISTISGPLGPGMTTSLTTT
jgi:hypothetical protein